MSNWAGRKETEAPTSCKTKIKHIMHAQEKCHDSPISSRTKYTFSNKYYYYKLYFVLDYVHAWILSEKALLTSLSEVRPGIEANHIMAIMPLTHCVYNNYSIKPWLNICRTGLLVLDIRAQVETFHKQSVHSLTMHVYRVLLFSFC